MHPATEIDMLKHNTRHPSFADKHYAFIYSIKPEQSYVAHQTQNCTCINFLCTLYTYD